MTHENGISSQSPEGCSTGPDRRITNMNNLTRASLATRRARARRRRRGVWRRRLIDGIRRLLMQLLERMCVQLLVDGIRDRWAWAATVDRVALMGKIAATISSLFS
ncbi:MAG: hypothetical protein IJG47_00890 [Microbacterium sp.]|nr:hypothetical protein [Microbacterium sp.]